VVHKVGRHQHAEDRDDREGDLGLLGVDGAKDDAERAQRRERHLPRQAVVGVRGGGVAQKGDDDDAEDDLRRGPAGGARRRLQTQRGDEALGRSAHRSMKGLPRGLAIREATQEREKENLLY